MLVFVYISLFIKLTDKSKILINNMFFQSKHTDLARWIGEALCALRACTGSDVTLYIIEAVTSVVLAVCCRVAVAQNYQRHRMVQLLITADQIKYNRS